MNANILMNIAFYGAIIWWAVKLARGLSVPDMMYSRERPAILRMEELRKDYDSISDLESVTKIVSNNPDLEIFMYCKYTDFGGGSEKECRIPIKPNSRLICLMCEEEKKRLRGDMGRTKKIFKLPFTK